VSLPTIRKQRRIVLGLDFCRLERLRDVSTDTEKQLKSRITELEKETSGNGRLRGRSYVSARELSYGKLILHGECR
jgi:hypothetical protein